MSTESRNRVQKGVATGGQFATESRPEDGSVALSGAGTPAKFTNPNDLPAAPIRLRLQHWDANDRAVTVEEAIVDGRTLLAGMSREDMDWHINTLYGREADDEILDWAQKDGLAKSWDGPYEFNVGAALEELHAKDPAILDQLSEARLDPTTYYRPGPDGNLVSAEESYWGDLEAQHDVFQKAQEDLAYLQLRPFVQEFEKIYPDVAEVEFAHDGDEDDPLFVNTITMKDGTSEVHDAGSLDGDFPVFAPGNAIATDRAYSFDEIRNFRPKR